MQSCFHPVLFLSFGCFEKNNFLFLLRLQLFVAAFCHANRDGGAGANKANSARADRMGGTTMTTTQTDENLVARTLAGDRNAFRALAENRYQSVYRLCRSILRHPEDAEDATQEVFVRAYQALGQYAGRGAFDAWLRRLTVNHCLNRTQTAAAKTSARSYSLDLLADTLPASQDFDPEESYLRAEDRARVREQLALLPQQERAAMSLRLLDNLSYEEIADMMNAPVNSVRSWLHRGRARLRAALQEVVEC